MTLQLKSIDIPNKKAIIDTGDGLYSVIWAKWAGDIILSDRSNEELTRNSVDVRSATDLIRNHLASAPKPSTEQLEQAVREAVNDNIENPSHYQILPGVEVIHVRRALIDKIPDDVPYNAIDEWSRAWEYLTRMWGKNGLEDAKKARVYLNWLIERMEQDR